MMSNTWKETENINMDLYIYKEINFIHLDFYNLKFFKKKFTYVCLYLKKSRNAAHTIKHYVLGGHYQINKIQFTESSFLKNSDIIFPRLRNRVLKRLCWGSSFLLCNMKTVINSCLRLICMTQDQEIQDKLNLVDKDIKGK